MMNKPNEIKEEEIIQDFLNDFRPIILAPEMEKAFLSHFTANFRSGYNLAESHLVRTISHYQVLGEFIRAERNLKFACGQVLAKHSFGWPEIETFGSLYGALCATIDVGFTSDRYIPDQQNHTELLNYTKRIRESFDKMEQDLKQNKLDFQIRFAFLKKRLDLAAEKNSKNKQPLI